MSIETVETRGKFFKNKKSKKQNNKKEEEKVPDLDNEFELQNYQDLKANENALSSQSPKDVQGAK